jgi:glycosyltransferase involved in cell wall biosynthesis
LTCLLYLTRVNIDRPSAQARQIKAMSEVFERLLGSSFTLVSAGCAGEIKCHRSLPNWVMRLGVPGVTLWLFVYAMRIWIIRGSRSVVFTRDIAVAVSLSKVSYPVIYEAHNSPQGMIAQTLWRMGANSKSFKWVFISNALKLFYQKHYAESAEALADSRTLVAHDGIFPDLYPNGPLSRVEKIDLRSALGLPSDKNLVVHTGSISEGRGAELFSAFLCDDRFYFVQVGGREVDIEFWKRFYEGKNIIFIPHCNREKVIKLQRCADILFYMITDRCPTYWCCSPLKIFEYFASSVPVIASACGSVLEVINDKCAIVCENQSKDALRKCINRSLTQDLDIQKLSENARDIVVTKYTWETRATQIIKFAEL